MLVCFDDDEAGREALARWQRRLPGIEPLPLPPGHNDVTDYWQAGGDLAAWATGERQKEAASGSAARQEANG